MNFDQVIALALGADATSTPTAGITEHTHTYTASPSTIAKAAWDGEEDGIHSIPGMYVTGLEISGEMGGNVEITVTTLVSQSVIDGAVNDQTVMDAVGYHTQEHIVHMRDEDAYFRINAQSGGSLAAADEACIESFTLSFQRNVDPIYCIGTGAETQQPVERAWPDVTLNVTFPKRVDAALPDTYGLLALAQAGTPLKAELMLRGGTLDATYDAQFMMQFPALTITEGLDLGIDNPNVNALEVPFLVTGTDSAPTLLR